MLKGLFILTTCAASALAVSVAAGVVPLSDVVATASELSCDVRDAFQLEPCAPLAASRAPAPLAAPRTDAPLEVARQVSPAAQQGPEPGKTPKPWDDPKWDDMVAAKLLEILLKLPDDGVRTGSLSEPDAPAPAGEQPRVQQPSMPETAAGPSAGEQARSEQDSARIPAEPIVAEPQTGQQSAASKAPAEPKMAAVAPLSPQPVPSSDWAEPVPLPRRENQINAAEAPRNQSERMNAQAAAVVPLPQPAAEPATNPAPVVTLQEPKSTEGASVEVAAPQLSPVEVARIDTAPVKPSQPPEAERMPSVPQTDARAPLPPARPTLSENPLAVARAGPLDPETERAAQAMGVASKKAAEQMATSYLKAWSSPNSEALPRLRKLSADRVEYFGKSISREAWTGIKRTFADKWPLRQYRPRPGSVATECDQRGRCTVRAIVDWTTAHPGRSDTITGSSKLELGIDMAGPQGVVYRESMLAIRSAIRRTLAAPDTRPPDIMTMDTRPPSRRVRPPPNLLPDDSEESVEIDPIY